MGCYRTRAMDVPDLKTERLLLRKIVLADAEHLQPLFNDWEVIRHLSKEVPWPYPPDGMTWFIENHCFPLMQTGERMVWVIVPDEVGHPVGLLEYRVGDHHRDNRGFWIGKPYQGRGYMTEAVEAFQDFIFFEQNVGKIMVCNSAINPESRRVKQKTGAERYGDLIVEHHNGECACESWIVKRERWAEIRGRALD